MSKFYDVLFRGQVVNRGKGGTGASLLKGQCVVGT